MKTDIFSHESKSDEVKYNPNWITVYPVDNEIVNLSDYERYNEADKLLSHLYTTCDGVPISYAFCKSKSIDDLLAVELLVYEEFDNPSVTERQYERAIEDFVTAAVFHRIEKLRKDYEILIVPKSIAKSSAMIKYMQTDDMFFKEETDRYIYSWPEVKEHLI